MCYCLDLRPDSGMAKFLSNRLVVFLIAVIQLLVWLSSLFVMIAPPESVKYQLADSKAGAIAFAVIFILSGIGFSILLILGVLKRKTTFVKVYCYFILVVIVLLMMSILVNIFTQPTRFGLSGFLSSTLVILLDILTFFVVRNYYLSQIKPPLANPNANPYSTGI